MFGDVFHKLVKLQRGEMLRDKINPRSLLLKLTYRSPTMAKYIQSYSNAP